MFVVVVCIGIGFCRNVLVGGVFVFGERILIGYCLMFFGNLSRCVGVCFGIGVGFSG